MLSERVSSNISLHVPKITRSEKLFYLAATVGAIATAIFASQGLLAMGSLIISSRLIAALIQRPWSHDVNPQIASAAKVNRFIYRQCLASALMAITYFGVAPAALWYTGSALFSAKFLDAAVCGLLTWKCANSAVDAGDQAAVFANYPDHKKKALLDMYSIIGLADKTNPNTISQELRSIANKYLKAAGHKLIGGRNLPELQRSLEIAQQKGETLSPRLIAALLEIYKDNIILEGNSRAQDFLAKYNGLEERDLAKHLLPLVGCSSINSFVRQHPSLDLATLSTYLSDEQFDTYFETKLVTDTLPKIKEISDKLNKQDWGKVESDVLSLFKRPGNNYSISDRLFLLSKNLESLQESASFPNFERLQELKQQVTQVLDSIANFYPTTDSCQELCQALDDETFQSYFLLDKLDTVEKRLGELQQGLLDQVKELGWDDPNYKIMQTLDDILTRVLIRLDTLPEQIDVRNERLSYLKSHQERAFKLRESLITQFPILKSGCVNLRRDYKMYGYFETETTQGKIPILDKEILKRFLFRTTDLPPVPKDKNEPQEWCIQNLQQEKEAAERRLKQWNNN